MQAPKSLVLITSPLNIYETQAWPAEAPHNIVFESESEGKPMNSTPSRTFLLGSLETMLPVDSLKPRCPSVLEIYVIVF